MVSEYSDQKYGYVVGSGN